MKKILLLITCLYTNQFLFAQTPVLFYPFAGNANAAIGSLNGTVSGATLTTDRFGNMNSAYNFDGTDDFILLNGSFSSYNEVTISAWYKLTGNSPNLQAIVSSDNSGKFIHMQVYTVGSNDNAVYVDNNNSILLGRQQVLLNTWTHIAITAKSGEAKLYENGILISSATTAFSFISPADLLRIGSGYLNGRFFKGSIDDIKIYNTALTASQISNLANNTETCNGFDDDGDGLIDETCVPTVSITGKNTNEGNNDTTYLKLTVTLSNDFENDVTVKYKTKNNTATAGSDYVEAESRVKFKPGQKSKKITIGVLGDLMVEPNEDFYVILTNPVNAVLGTDTALGKIKNDDASFYKSGNPVADNPIKNELQVTVFPNPAKNTIIVSGINGSNIPIEITDMFGSPMIKQTVNERERINISTLPQGHYVVKLLYPGSIRTVKFVKQ